MIILDQSNYHKSIRHQVYMKFKDKIEEQEVRHTKEIKTLTEKLDKTVKDFTSQMEKQKKESVEKLMIYYNMVKEKDEALTELSSKVDDYRATLKDINETKYGQEEYTLITINNALRTNLKWSEKEVEKLNKQNSDLKQLFDFKQFTSQQKEFEKEMEMISLDPNYELNNSEFFQNNFSKNVEKIKHLMKVSEIQMKDLF